MTESNFDQLKQQLLSRMVSGEITRDEYNEMLAEVTKHESSASGDTAGPVSADTGGAVSSDRHDIEATGRRSGSRLESGRTLQAHRLVEQLGRGGMGEVWKAWDSVGERDVVLKVLPEELAGNQDEMARIRASFKRVHALNHQNICPTYALGRDEEIGYFLVMKYLDGGTLNWYRRAHVKKFGDFPLEEVTRLLGPVANALDYAHEHKVIHRDIKPENVMVSRDGKQLHLVDFGLAAEVRTSLARVSQVQMDNSGTYPYMAPEQWRAQHQDARTDQYALGVMAYELIAGRLPFESADMTILMRAALEEDPAEIDDQPPHVNAALARAMSKDRKQRFASCREFVDALADADSEVSVEQQRPAESVKTDDRPAPPSSSSSTEAPQASTRPAISGSDAARLARRPQLMQLQDELAKLDQALKKHRAWSRPVWKFFKRLLWALIGGGAVSGVICGIAAGVTRDDEVVMGSFFIPFGSCVFIALLMGVFVDLRLAKRKRQEWAARRDETIDRITTAFGDEIRERGGPDFLVNEKIVRDMRRQLARELAG